MVRANASKSSGSATGSAPGEWFGVDLHGVSLADLSERRARGERRVLLTRHLPALKAGGSRLALARLRVDPTMAADRQLRALLTAIGALYQELDESPDALVLVKSRADLRAIERGHRIGLVLTLDCPVALQAGPPETPRLVAELGARIVSLAAAVDQPGARLSRDTTSLTRALNGVGIVIDLVGLAGDSFADAVAQAHGPVVATDVVAGALNDHPDALTDAQAYAIAATGGLIGVSRNPAKLGSRGLADHVRYLSELVGVDKVALAGGQAASADGPASPAPDQLAEQLAARELSPEAAREVFGGSALRFLKKVLP